MRAAGGAGVDMQTHLVLELLLLELYIEVGGGLVHTSLLLRGTRQHAITAQSKKRAHSGCSYHLEVVAGVALV